MQMTIASRSADLTQPIREHIRARLYAALDQHASRINRVEVTIDDENGPRGGIDQVCRVVVRLTNGQTLHHVRRGIDLYANVSLIADKAKRRVGRRIAKIKDRRKAA
ncbi:MAG: HPF/RaiA family ribosome-associated protein [Phycisphaeraceae bacterium]